jgi:hypothetical protein
MSRFGQAEGPIGVRQIEFVLAAPNQASLVSAAGSEDPSR